MIEDVVMSHFLSELRRATLPIFYDMMIVEFSEHHDFKKVS